MSCFDIWICHRSHFGSRYHIRLMRFASLFDLGSNPGATLFGRSKFFELKYKNGDILTFWFWIILQRGGPFHDSGHSWAKQKKEVSESEKMSELLEFAAFHKNWNSLGFPKSVTGKKYSSQPRIRKSLFKCGSVSLKLAIVSWELVLVHLVNSGFALCALQFLLWCVVWFRSLNLVVSNFSTAGWFLIRL